MNLQDFKAKWAEIQPALLIEREVAPVYQSGVLQDTMRRKKIITYATMILTFLAGVVLIIVGGAEQKHHQVMIPLIVVGLILAIIVTLGVYTAWTLLTYQTLKQVTERSFKPARILQIYLNILKAFPFFQCHTQDTFIENDGFITLGGKLQNGSHFKVTASKRDVRFFLNQQLVQVKDTNLQYWNTQILLKVSILDPFKMQTNEAFIQTIVSQIERNLGAILGNLFTVYGGGKDF